jgi:hypothetical protein
MHEPARECRPYLSLNRAGLTCVHFRSKSMVESFDVHEALALLPEKRHSHSILADNKFRCPVRIAF